jgi:hypothetical protein
MKIHSRLIGLSLAVLAMATPALAQQKGGLDETGPYQAAAGWYKPPINGWDQPVISVVVDNSNRIIIGAGDQSVTQPNAPIIDMDGSVRKERSTTSTKPAAEKTHAHQIMVLDGTGKTIETWSQWDARIDQPHSIYISPYDPERHVWVVNRMGHEILKFTNDGKKLVQVLGERIVRFNKAGKYVNEWGTKGSGPGQFQLVHAVTIDPQGRIYAADRNNNRVQVFDKDGKFIEEWPNIRSVTKLIVTNDNAIYLASAAGYNRMAKFDLNGKLLTYWGMTGSAPGLFDNPHQFAVDDQGNLFIADAWNNRLQKFTPKPDADKSRLMTTEYVFPKK